MHELLDTILKCCKTNKSDYAKKYEEMLAECDDAVERVDVSSAEQTVMQKKSRNRLKKLLLKRFVPSAENL